MAKLVVLRLDGDFSRGFNTTLNLGWEGKFPDIEMADCTLPPVPTLDKTYQHWQFLYRSLCLASRTITPKKITIDGSLEQRKQECREIAEKLALNLNQWLRSPSFRPIRDVCQTQLNSTDEIRLIIRSGCYSVLQLPWDRWDFMESYLGLEIGISHVKAGVSLAIAPPSEKSRHDRQVRILSILGDSHAIDIGGDRAILEQLPNADITTLVEPKRQQLSDRLWEQSWDILFFAGHGNTEGETGRIYLSTTDSLTVGDLKHGLKTAIAKGLQLAIFNSCAGLGLAWQLEALNIPQMIVMREMVPDRIAREFLKYFLSAFSEGKSLYLSVREARERLQGLEDEFPCASGLPVIYQRPSAIPPTWQVLIRGQERRSPRLEPTTMVFTDLVNSTALKKHLEGREIGDRNRYYLEKILTPHREKVARLLTSYRGRIVNTGGDSHFLVFSTASQAAQWSVALQLSHRDEAIETPLGPLQVRIGMHTGNPPHDGNDFIGQEVDYAARIGGLANGEQILLSEVSELFIRNADLADLSIHNHGKHLLKGIGKVPIFELLYSDKSPQLVRASKRVKDWTISAIGSAIAAAFIIGLRFMGVLQPLELKIFDHLIQMRPHEGMDSRLLVVEATEEDVNRYGFPLPDSVLADLIEKLQVHQPYAIGLDIFRDQPREPGSERLRDQWQRNRRLMGVCSPREANNPNKPGIAPPRELARERLGFSDVVVDPDGVLRRHLVFMQPYHNDLCATDHAFSSRIAFDYLAGKGIEPKTLAKDRIQVGKAVFQDLSPRAGGYQGLDAGGFQVLLNYRGGEIVRRVRLGDVLEEAIEPGWVSDRIVLIGMTAPISADYFYTPYSSASWPYEKVPGVIVQAQMVSQILSAAMAGRSLIGVCPVWQEGLWILGWSAIGGLMAWRCRRVLYWVIATGGVVLVLYGACWGLLMGGTWVPLVPAAIALLLSGGGVVAVRIIREG